MSRKKPATAKLESKPAPEKYVPTAHERKAMEAYIARENCHACGRPFAPPLPNARHERFAQEIAKGLSATEAYARAGYRGDRTAASRLSTNANIQGRVAELLKRGAELAECTVASIINELEEARGIARSIEQPATMVSSSMGKAKVAGLLVDKTALTNSDGDNLELPSPRKLALAFFALLSEARLADADKAKTIDHLAGDRQS